MSELTYLNITENLKLLLEMQGRSYIYDVRKEASAITKFTMEGFKPDYVLELIGKLIEIKRHSKLGKENFWKGCAVNLSDAYAYRVKIETVYPTIATITSPTVGVENFQPAIMQKPATQSKDAMNRVSTPTDPWQTFLNWSKKLTGSSQSEIAKMTAVLDDKMILITGYPPEHLQNIITQYWTNIGLSVVYKKPNN